MWWRSWTSFDVCRMVSSWVQKEVVRRWTKAERISRIAAVVSVIELSLWVLCFLRRQGWATSRILHLPLVVTLSSESFLLMPVSGHDKFDVFLKMSISWSEVIATIRNSAAEAADDKWRIQLVAGTWINWADKVDKLHPWACLWTGVLLSCRRIPEFFIAITRHGIPSPFGSL